MTISSILHIDTGKSWGGGQIQTLYLIRGLQAAELKSLLICQPESPLYRRCSEENIPCNPVRVRGDLDPIAAWKIRSLLSRNSFDIKGYMSPYMDDPDRCRLVVFYLLF